MIPVLVVIISPSATARQRGRQGTLLPVGQRVRLGPLEATGHVTPAIGQPSPGDATNVKIDICIDRLIE